MDWWWDSWTCSLLSDSKGTVDPRSVTEIESDTLNVSKRLVSNDLSVSLQNASY